MNKSFNHQYSQYYDLMYRNEKDYRKECDFIEMAMRRYLKRKAPSILDIACGTGRHVIELSRRGYEVAGSDISNDMIRIAQKNSKKEGLPIGYHLAPMETLRTGKTYDVILCMFAAFDYLLEKKNVKKMLQTLRTHLKPGGIFIMDFWNRDKFLNSSERFRVKDISCGDLRLLRISESENDPKKDLLKMKIKCLVLKNRKLIDEFIEEHSMRYWEPALLGAIFEESGLNVLSLAPFLKLGGKIQDHWTLSMIARKDN